MKQILAMTVAVTLGGATQAAGQALYEVSTTCYSAGFQGPASCVENYKLVKEKMTEDECTKSAALKDPKPNALSNTQTVCKMVDDTRETYQINVVTEPVPPGPGQKPSDAYLDPKGSDPNLNTFAVKPQ